MTLLFLIFTLLSLLSCEDNDPVSVDPADQDSTWTYIVYGSLNAHALYINQGLCSNEYIDLIGIYDSPDDEGIIWRIDEQNDLVILETLGSINSGSEETLFDLVMYAKANYPADRYILTIFGHGGSFFGCCGDPVFQDGLRLHEMSNAIERAGSVDMVLFTAPCYMGCVEMAYELRDCTDIVIASEEVSGFIFWNRTLEDIFSALQLEPTVSPTGLAEMIIAEMPEHSAYYAEEDMDSYLTMSAVRTDMMDPLGRAIDELTVALLEDPAAFETWVDANYEALTTFGGYWSGVDHLVDLGSLTEHLTTSEADENTLALLTRVRDRLDDAVFAECHSDNFTDVSGLTIFLPTSDYEWFSYYTGEEDMTLEFTRDTRWDELVSFLIEYDTGKYNKTLPWWIKPGGALSSPIIELDP